MNAVVTHGGIGDQLHGFKCARAIGIVNDPVVFCSSDETKYQVLNYLFDGDIVSFRFDESLCQNDAIVKDPSIIDSLFKSWAPKLENLYVSWPDLLESNPYAFPYLKYKISLQELYSSRILTHRWNPENLIFIAPCSSTSGYQYNEAISLAKELGELLPNYHIYVSLVKQWAGKSLGWNQLESGSLSRNVTVAVDTDFIDSIKVLERSCYCICSDNGISHIAYALGMPRLLLDPRYGYGNEIMWHARWRPIGMFESVPVSVSPGLAAKVVETNLLQEQTMLIPRAVVVQDLKANWKIRLGVKY